VICQGLILLDFTAFSGVQSYTDTSSAGPSGDASVSDLEHFVVLWTICNFTSIFSAGHPWPMNVLAVRHLTDDVSYENSY